MKKILILFLCIILTACALVACNNTDGEQINISEYKIVVPSDCHMSTEHAARNLAALIKDKTGKELSIVYDSEAPAANEILIGETNREESKTTTPLDEMQYLLFEKNGKIVMKGNGIYVKRFNEAISYATQFTLCHPDTALVVTADHETGKLTPASGGVGYYFLSYNHTNIDVPVFAIGPKTDELNGKTLENTELAKFCASVYTSEPFGQAVPIE